MRKAFLRNLKLKVERATSFTDRFEGRVASQKGKALLRELTFVNFPRQTSFTSFPSYTTNIIAFFLAVPLLYSVVIKCYCYPITKSVQNRYNHYPISIGDFLLCAYLIERFTMTYMHVLWNRSHILIYYLQLVRNRKTREKALIFGNFCDFHEIFLGLKFMRF